MGTKQRAEDFIGWKSQDGNLEVIGIHGRDKKGEAIFSVKCRICCNDSELFGDGVFTSTKHSLIKGVKPCGCSFSPKWNERQWIIRANRVSNGKFTVNGYDGDFKGSATKINMTCTTCNHSWNSSLHNVVNNGHGCPECGYVATGAKLNTSSSFIGWTSEDKNLEVIGIKCKKGSSTMFNVICHICAKDPELFGDGIFTSPKHSLTKGMKPCGCSLNPKWSEYQWMVRIKRIADDKFKVTGVVGEFKGQVTKLNLHCNNCAHDWVATVGSITSGHGCPKCARESSKLVSGMYGFYANRINEIDNLYVLDFDGKYIKVGRSFDVNRRIWELQKLSGIDNISIIKVIQDTHTNIFKLEQELHEELRERGFQCELEWTTECFDMDSLKLINKLL